MRLYCQVRIYRIALLDTEIDSHMQLAGLQWQVHQKYVTAHFNMDDNTVSGNLTDTGLLALDGIIYGQPQFVEVSSHDVHLLSYQM